jgi:hypothetical protein
MAAPLTGEPAERPPSAAHAAPAGPSAAGRFGIADRCRAPARSAGSAPRQGFIL